MEEPTKCPHCGKDYAGYYHNQIRKDCYVDFCCHCKNPILFVTDWDTDYLINYFPKKFINDLPVEIKQFSPTGYEIFSQCLIAQAENADLILGPGLRKCLEFLVNDYLINVQKHSKENLKKVLIDNIRLLDENLYANSVANLIRILGNDLTHYRNKYNAQNIELFENIKILANLMRARFLSMQADKRLKELSQQVQM